MAKRSRRKSFQPVQVKLNVPAGRDIFDSVFGENWPLIGETEGGAQEGILRRVGRLAVLQVPRGFINLGIMGVRELNRLARQGKDSLESQESDGLGNDLRSALNRANKAADKVYGEGKTAGWFDW